MLPWMLLLLALLLTAAATHRVKRVCWHTRSLVVTEDSSEGLQLSILCSIAMALSWRYATESCTFSIVRKSQEDRRVMQCCLYASLLYSIAQFENLHLCLSNALTKLQTKLQIMCQTKLQIMCQP